MKNSAENLLWLVSHGASVEFNPSNMPYTKLRQIVRAATHTQGCKVTLHNTDAFSDDEWKLLAEDGKGHIAVVFG